MKIRIVPQAYWKYPLFLSGTGQYVMDFPAEGVIGERGYSIKEDAYEELQIYIDGPTGSRIFINYYSHFKAEFISEYIEGFKLRLNYEGEFETIEEDKQILHYATLNSDIYTVYAGFLQNQMGPGGIEIVYEIDCKEENGENCVLEDLNKESVIKWMKSIQYLNGEK